MVYFLYILVIAALIFLWWLFARMFMNKDTESNES
jgi:hypothetical protein